MSVRCQDNTYWIGPEGKKGMGLFASRYMQMGCVAATIEMNGLKRGAYTPLGMWIGSRCRRNVEYTWRTAHGYIDGDPKLDGEYVNGVLV